MTSTSCRPPEPTEPGASPQLPSEMRGHLGTSVPQPGAAALLVTTADLHDLPEAAARYLAFMEVVGRPRARWSYTELEGDERSRPGGSWSPVRERRFVRALPVTRLALTRRRFGPVPVTGRDTYRAGRGSESRRLLGALPLPPRTGRHIDTDQQLAWLADAVLTAPALLLDPAVRWSAGRPDTFGVALTDCGRTVAVTVAVDASGAPLEVISDDRYAFLPGGMDRTRWRTDVEGWTYRRGRPLPTRLAMVWQLPAGPFTYAVLEPVDVMADAPPESSLPPGDRWPAVRNGARP